MEDYPEVERLTRRVTLGEYDYSPDKFKSAIVRLKSLPYIPVGVVDDAEKNGYKRKQEYHVTLFPDELFESLPNRQVADELADALRNVCDHHPVVELSDDLYQISRTKTVVENGAEVEYERESIVIPLEQGSDFVKDTNEVFAKYGLDEDEYPFLHVTLFTRPDNTYADAGIGIASVEEWRAMEPRLYGHIEQAS